MKDEKSEFIDGWEKVAEMSGGVEVPLLILEMQYKKHLHQSKAYRHSESDYLKKAEEWRKIAETEEELLSQTKRAILKLGGKIPTEEEIDDDGVAAVVVPHVAGPADDTSRLHRQGEGVVIRYRGIGVGYAASPRTDQGIDLGAGRTLLRTRGQKQEKCQHRQSAGGSQV